MLPKPYCWLDEGGGGQQFEVFDLRTISPRFVRGCLVLEMDSISFQCGVTTYVDCAPLVNFVSGGLNICIFTTVILYPWMFSARSTES